MSKKIFSYEEALELLPEVQRLTGAAVDEIDSLVGPPDSEKEDQEIPLELASSYQEIVGRWAEAIIKMGIEVKGLWLVDFDSGSGYYCWRYSEPSLQYFHGYEEGIAGRIKLN